MKKLFIIALMCVMALSMSAQYVDLGLPSGTKWKTTNESGFYSFYQAKSTFSDNLPEKWQWDELIDHCTWKWTGNGYIATGKNGNTIFFPAAGFKYRGEVVSAGTCGKYISLTPAPKDNITHIENIWILYFADHFEGDAPQMSYGNKSDESFCVRLVQQ